jgi:deoxyribonuclease-4
LGICPHRFGPAGKPIEFKGDLADIPAFLKSIGLNAMEYEAVRGVNIKKEKAEVFGQKARENDVLLSLHGPYYINLASPEEKTVQASVRRIYESLRASHWMSAYAVVIHTGYYGDLNPSEAIRLAIKGYKEALEQAWSDGYVFPSVSPETTGKTTQIGTVEEVVEICLSLGKKCRPTVDWAHIYARTKGELIQKVDDVIKIIEYIESNLGKDAVSPLHTHFSKIEFGKGGEREHHTLEEELYGPSFDVVVKAYKEVGVTGTFISESPILEKDALLMKKICEDIY